MTQKVSKKKADAVKDVPSGTGKQLCDQVECHRVAEVFLKDLDSVEQMQFCKKCWEKIMPEQAKPKESSSKIWSYIRYLYSQNEKLWERIAELEQSNVETRALIK